MSAHARVRRGAAALVVAFLGLFFMAAPAAANTMVPWPTGTGDGSTVWVGINNGGSGPILVKVSGGTSEYNVNLTSGCGTAPPEGVLFAICLPAGAYTAFTTFLAPPEPAPETD
jgi:hypothetical protein